jgi:putative transposase
MQRDAPFLEGNIYHIYNRGAHKADIFLEENDYFRFKLLLFLANTDSSLSVRDVIRKHPARGRSSGRVFYEEKPDQGLVEVMAYALMPNHFHLILRQKTENGITQFMKKVATAYSMYFNTLYEHSGTVFQGRFRSRHVGEGDYLRWLFAYVALNPLDVGFPGWKEKGVDPHKAFSFLQSYQHASFPDMQGAGKRPEQAILSQEALRDVASDVPDFSNVSELFEIEKNEIE